MKVESLCFSPNLNIYRALLLRIEHCKTEKSKHRLHVFTAIFQKILLLTFFTLRNSLSSYDEAIVVVRKSIEHFSLEPVLLSMGFTKHENQSHVVFLPCPLGSFSKSLGRKNWKCVACSPGMLQFGRL